MTEVESQMILDDFEANHRDHLYRSRWDAAHAAQVVPQLRGCLSSHEFPTLLRALSALHCIGPEAYGALPEVTRMFDHQQPKVREAAIWALTSICLRSPDDAIPRLVEAAEDPVLTRTAMHALILFGRNAVAALPVFVSAFDNPDSRQRLLAIRGIKEIGADLAEVEGVVRRAIGDRSKAVRESVEKLLNCRLSDRENP